MRTMTAVEVGRRSRRRWIGVLAVVAAGSVGFAVGDALATPASVAATTPGHSERGTLDYHWAWALAPGKTLEIEGVNGAIRAVGVARGEVVVDAHKHARRSNPDDVTVEVIPHEGGITLCVHYPDVLFGEHNTCEPGGKSHMNTRNNDVAVDFEVKLPPGVKLSARTVNGTVEARDVDGACEAQTVNGSVDLATRGWARARTVNGGIRVRLGGSPPPDGLSFRTVNGSVTIDLPEDFAADVHAETVNGRIDSEFPLMVQGRMVGRHIDGKLGKGGPDLEVKTVNGSISLRRRTSL